MMMATLLVMFLIKHSSGTEDILTVRKVSVQQHQTIIIPCLYDQKYVSNVKYVSSGGLWLFSRYVTHSRMSVVDNKTEKFFTATLSNAEVRDSGTYWCGISRAGYDDGKKIHLEVIKGEPRLHVSSQHVSGYEGGNAVVVCHGASQWCQIGGSCVGRNGGTSNKTVVQISGDALNVTLRELKREDSGWYYCADGESQMPVHITVRNAPYTGRGPVHYTESGQDQPGLKRVLWPGILGAMLPVIVCAAVILIKVNHKRKQRGETPNPSEGRNNQHSPKGNEKTDEVTCENLYEESGIKQNIQGNEKNDEVTCENLYEESGIKQNIQGNKKNEEVTCDSLYEIMSGTKNIQGNEVTYDNLDEIMCGTKNIQGKEKNSEDENLYEIMTGIKQNVQMTAMDNKNMYLWSEK